MVMKNDGRERSSKANKKKHKLKQVKCKSCKSLNEYYEADLEFSNGMRSVMCNFCENEIIIK